MEIKSKHSIGDTVYFATTTTKTERHPCPDCDGTRKWKAISPAGGEYEFTCPRCSSGYKSDDTLTYSIGEACVRKLTVGSVQFNSKPYGNSGDQFSYMCVETGVGSGSVYGESQLFDTEEKALNVAKAKAAAMVTDIPWMAARYKKTLELSDYQLDNLKIIQGKDAISRARSMIDNIVDLFERISECDDKDAILEQIDDYRNWDHARDIKKADGATP